MVFTGYFLHLHSDRQSRPGRRRVVSGDHERLSGARRRERKKEEK
jgi:hypothetical protein